MNEVFEGVALAQELEKRALAQRPPKAPKCPYCGRRPTMRVGALLPGGLVQWVVGLPCCSTAYIGKTCDSSGLQRRRAKELEELRERVK